MNALLFSMGAMNLNHEKMLIAEKQNVFMPATFAHDLAEFESPLKRVKTEHDYGKLQVIPGAWPKVWTTACPIPFANHLGTNVHLEEEEEEEEDDLEEISAEELDKIYQDEALREAAEYLGERYEEEQASDEEYLDEESDEDIRIKKRWLDFDYCTNNMSFQEYNDDVENTGTVDCVLIGVKRDDFREEDELVAYELEEGEIQEGEDEEDDDEIWNQAIHFGNEFFSNANNLPEVPVEDEEASDEASDDEEDEEASDESSDEEDEEEEEEDNVFFRNDEDESFYKRCRIA
jgi:hypothetical protein